MNLFEKRKIQKLLKDADTVLLVTDKGVGICGFEPDVLTHFGVLVKYLAEQGISKEVLKLNFDAAFMTSEELDELAKSKLDELLNKIKEAMEK